MYANSLEGNARLAVGKIQSQMKFPLNIIMEKFRESNKYLYNKSSSWCATNMLAEVPGSITVKRDAFFKIKTCPRSISSNIVHHIYYIHYRPIL
jgi:hypothetical protein